MTAVEESDERLAVFHETVATEDPLRNQGLLWEKHMHHPSRRIQGRIGEVVEWGRRHGEIEQVEARLASWGERFPQTGVSLARELADVRYRNATEVHNEVLFDPDATTPPNVYDSREKWWEAVESGEPWPWVRTYRAGTKPVFRAEEQPEGGVGLSASGAIEEKLYLYVPIEEGALCEFSALAQGRNGNGSQVRLRVYWYDEQGELVESDRVLFDQLAEGRTQGTKKLTVIARAPETTTYAYLVLEVNEQAEEDFITFGQIEMNWVRGRE